MAVGCVYQGQYMNKTRKYFGNCYMRLTNHFIRKIDKWTEFKQGSIFWLLIGMGMRKILFAFSFEILIFFWKTEGTIYGDKRDGIVDMLPSLICSVNW